MPDATDTSARNPEMNSSDRDRDYAAMSRYTVAKVLPRRTSAVHADQYHAPRNDAEGQPTGEVRSRKSRRYEAKGRI